MIKKDIVYRKWWLKHRENSCKNELKGKGEQFSTFQTIYINRGYMLFWEKCTGISYIQWLYVMPVHFSKENKRHCKCDKDCYSIQIWLVPGSENMEISSPKFKFFRAGEGARFVHAMVNLETDLYLAPDLYKTLGGVSLLLSQKIDMNFLML